MVVSRCTPGSAPRARARPRSRASRRGRARRPARLRRSTARHPIPVYGPGTGRRRSARPRESRRPPAGPRPGPAARRGVEPADLDVHLDDPAPASARARRRRATSGPGEVRAAAHPGSGGEVGDPLVEPCGHAGPCGYTSEAKVATPTAEHAESSSSAAGSGSASPCRSAGRVVEEGPDLAQHPLRQEMRVQVDQPFGDHLADPGR